MRFNGWNHPGKPVAEYRARFSRPRARAVRAEILKNAAPVGDHSNVRSSFSPSALPGILLRDSLPAGFIPSAVATGDFNDDGELDFVVANGGDNNLWFYFGNGSGTFSLPIIVPISLGQSPVWIATGDLRGIGRTDVVVAEADTNSVGIFLSNGDGTFVENVVGLGDTASVVLVGDFNHDGKLDIVAPLNDADANEYIVMLPGRGNGSFGTPVNTPLSGNGPGIFWGSSADLNGDGVPDLVLTSVIDPIAIQVYLGNGDGTFAPGQVVAQNYDPDINLGSIEFDANGDGNNDILVTDTFGLLWVYSGNGDGTFSTNPSTFGYGDVGYSIAAADVNGDGILDVVISGVFVDDIEQYGTEAGDQICVLEGDGKGNFSFPTLYRGDSSSYSMAMGDFNGDGHPDFVTANQNNDSATVFMNDGMGGFGEPSGQWVGYEESGSTVNAPETGAMLADIDGNGSTDIAFIEYGLDSENYLQLTVLLNDGSGNLSAPLRSNAVATSYELPQNFVLADFRNTGLPDFLAIAPNYNSNPNYISFAPNNGGGLFGTPTGTNSANATGVVGVGDFNGDGKLDFVAAGYGINFNANNVQGIQVYLGNGDGTFKAGYVQSFGGTYDARAPEAVYVGDYNRDGKLDLLILLEGNGGYNGNADLYEFMGNGDGTFQTGTLLIQNLGPMTVADVDNDGHPDIVSMLYQLSGNNSPISTQFSIYIGQPNGTFKLTNTYAPYNGASTFPQQVFSPIYGNYAPMVADFNGDGNLDIASFQQIGAQNVDVFAQFLLGNGDGTFTPTYDIFDFRKTEVTAYAADLLGTGHADLFELNGYRSSYNLLPNIVAPPFQFSLVEDPVSGSQGSAIVLLDVPVSTATTVTLNSSDSAIRVPPSVTVPAGSVSQTFSFTIGSSFNTSHVFSITAKLGLTSVVAYGTAAASGSAGFLASAGGESPWPDVDLGPGQAQANLGVTAASVNGSTTTATATCTGLPSFAQCVISPPTLFVRPGDTARSVLSISVGANAQQGSYKANVVVTDGVITQTFPFTINVGDFTMSLSPSALQMLPNGENSYSLSVGAVNKFDQDVTLSCGGLPPGASCSSVPFTIPGSTPVTVGVGTQSVPTGNYQIVVTGISTSLTHTATAQLQVWDFNPSVTPASAIVSAGGSSNFNVVVSPVNGFDGTVNFSCMATVAVSCAFNPTSMSLPANGPATSVLTLAASSGQKSSERPVRSATAARRFWYLGIILPLGIVVSNIGRKRQASITVLCLMALLCMIPSCGGGSFNDSGGGGGTGGGGSGSTTYSIVVQVSSGNETKTAGTISLTVQ